jgi:hypothetical protein
MNLVGNRTSWTTAFSNAFVFALLLAIGYGCSRTQAGPKSSGQSSAVNPAAASSTASVIVISGQITSVDQEKKLVRLQPVRGKQVLLHVYTPYNFAAVEPGELFIARFYEVVTVQKLALAQSPPAQSLTAGIVSAVPGEAPGVAFASPYQFVVAIDAIYKNDKRISIKGSDGVVEVVEVANPQSLDQVQLGEEIVVTLMDVIASSLDKEPTVRQPAVPIVAPGT